MELGTLATVLKAAYDVYNKFEETTDELFQMKQKIEQLQPVVLSVQALYLFK